MLAVTDVGGFLNLSSVNRKPIDRFFCTLDTFWVFVWGIRGKTNKLAETLTGLRQLCFVPSFTQILILLQILICHLSLCDNKNKATNKYIQSQHNLYCNCSVKMNKKRWYQSQYKLNQDLNQNQDLSKRRYTVKMAWVGRRHGLTNTRFVTCLLGSFQSSHPHKQIPIQLTSVYWCENNFLIFLLLFCFASNKTCVGQTMPAVNSCHFYQRKSIERNRTSISHRINRTQSNTIVRLVFDCIRQSNTNRTFTSFLRLVRLIRRSIAFDYRSIMFDYHSIDSI